MNRSHSRFPINQLVAPENKIIIYRRNNKMKAKPVANRENVAIFKARKDYRDNDVSATHISRAC